MEFYWSERIWILLFLGSSVSSEEFWPNIRSDSAGFKFKHLIPERPDSRKFLEIRLNFYEFKSMELRVFELFREA